MESKWAGGIEAAFFNIDKFNSHRTIIKTELEATTHAKSTRETYYVLGVDVGRHECSSEVAVIKVTKLDQGEADLKQVVNLITLPQDSFVIQTLLIKRLFHKYKARAIVVDANGMGAGLVDLLVVDSVDPETDEVLGGLGVMRDKDDRYKDKETENTIHNALWPMRANQTINSELYTYCKTQLNHGKLKFLIDEGTAKTKLESLVKTQTMSAIKREEHLQPYVYTSILRDQMANLITVNEGTLIILKQDNRRIKKDKFSALIYALAWCKDQEARAGKRKSRDFSNCMFFTPQR